MTVYSQEHEVGTPYIDQHQLRKHYKTLQDFLCIIFSIDAEKASIEKTLLMLINIRIDTYIDQHQIGAQSQPTPKPKNYLCIFQYCRLIRWQLVATCSLAPTDSGVIIRMAGCRRAMCTNCRRGMNSC